MRKILFLSTFWVVIGLTGPVSQEAAAQCTHFGNQGACPVGIPNGSTSVTVNANGTITWNSGGVSGPCCAAPSGTETGAGLLNLNNELGGGPFHFGPTVDGLGGTSDPGVNSRPGDEAVILTGTGFEDRLLGSPNCDFSGCSGNDLLGDVFGANPNSGYQCDSGGPGCGNDLWTSAPRPGFGSCDAGGCGDPAPITPLDFSNVPRIGPYGQNITTGDIDPFGGGSSFQDPLTGEAIDISDNPAEWPSHVKHADELNSAYVNGEIGYPFNDPDWRTKSVEDFENEPPPGVDNVSRPLEPYSDKAGRFGIGADTSLGGVGGLSARFQVAKNFGIQAIASFPPVGIDDENPNADLTDYVSAVIVSTQPGTRPANFVSVLPAVTPTPAPASTPANQDTEAPPEPVANSTILRFRGWNSLSGVARIEKEGEPTVYSVTTSGGRELVFKSRADAFLFSDRFNAEIGEKDYNRIVGELPADRGPINVGPVNTDAVDTLTENVPKEFQAPRVNTIRGDEFLITDPQTGRQIEVKSAEQRDTVLNAMRNGATLEQAAKIAQNAPTVTRDGLASANSGGASTRSTPAPAGSAPTFTNNRPAIIVPPAVTSTPDGLASANSGGVTTPSTPAPAGSAPTFTNNRPAIIVPPTRPEGTSAGTMKGLLAGNAYDIEIIRTPGGKLLAVGTGENANHVFGEVKETSNKLFGDFRREGPWSPPPAKTQTATATTPAVTPDPQAANNRVRSQIANSDRDHMTRNIFLDGFESGDT